MCVHRIERAAQKLELAATRVCRRQLAARVIGIVIRTR
jgi:hypothetical protein